MGRFQLELINLYFLPSFHQIVVVSVLQAFRCNNKERPTGQKHGRTVENKDKLILTVIFVP